MTITTQEFVKQIGGEIVAGKIIVGQMAERRIIGDVGPVLELTEEGTQMLAEAEVAIAKRVAKKLAAEQASPPPGPGDTPPAA